MEVALASDFSIYELSPESMEEQMAKLEKAGITHVHWAHDWDYEYIYSQWEMIQIKEILERHHLKVKAVHASEGNTRCRVINGQPVFVNRSRMRDFRKDFTSLNEYNRLAGVELLLNRVDLAYMVGAKEIVTHMVVPYEDFENIPGFKEKYYEQVFKSFDQMEPYCRAKGIRIAVENMICTPKKYQYEKFDRLFERYSPDYVGLCFDSGHSIITIEDEENREPDWKFLERYKDRLIAMHLDDNLGINYELSADIDGAIQKSDKHWIPFKGIASWDKICQLIAESPYELPLLLEIVVPKKDTVEDEMEGLAEAKAVGEKLTNMVLEYRNK